MVFSCLKSSRSKVFRSSGSTSPVKLCSTGIRRRVPSAASTSAGSTRRGISSLEYSFNAGSFARKVAMICSSVGFDSSMPISNAIFVPEMSMHDARPKPRRNDHVEEKARTRFSVTRLEFSLDPAGQERTGERVDAGGGDGRRGGSIKDNRSTKFAGLEDAGMGFVKGFRRWYAIGHLPDVKICPAVEPVNNHAEPAFIGKKKMQDTLAEAELVLQPVAVISQLLRGGSRVQHFT